jgi:hypothetical protein
VTVAIGPGSTFAGYRIESLIGRYVEGSDLKSVLESGGTSQSPRSFPAITYYRPSGRSAKRAKHFSFA